MEVGLQHLRIDTEQASFHSVGVGDDAPVEHGRGSWNRGDRGTKATGRARLGGGNPQASPTERVDDSIGKRGVSDPVDRRLHRIEDPRVEFAQRGVHIDGRIWSRLGLEDDKHLRRRCTVVHEQRLESRQLARLLHDGLDGTGQ